MIELLDAAVLPELRQGRYPQRSSSRRVAEMAHAIVHNLDMAATAGKRPEPARARTHPGPPRSSSTQ